MIVSFKFYVMNFVDFVFDFYSHITSHVSQAFASCTHYTSYSLLNFVHVIVCDFVVAIQDYIFLDFDAKFGFEDKLVDKFVFGRSGLNSCVFEKLLGSYSCISFMKYCALRSYCIKLLCFSKIWVFQNFDRSKLFLDRSKLRLKFLVWFCLTRLVFDRCSIDRNWKIFSF